MKAFKANSRDRDSSGSEAEADTILKFLRRGLTEETKVAERKGEGEDDDKKEMREE